jgi:hypothetical protein
MVAILLGLLLHPQILAWVRSLPQARLVTVSLGLGLVAAVAASSRTPAERLFAAGVFAAALGFGYDLTRGHSGTLALALGEASHLFEEQGPNGTKIGLRPLGFETRLEAIEGSSARLALPGGARLLAPGHAFSVGGFRLGQPTPEPTGEAARLRLAVTEEGRTTDVDLVPPESAHVGNLEIVVDRYFADFALDAKGQPYSRSPEARNPAALLKVESPAGLFPVFVIRALPGIHEQPGLPASFALVSVDPLWVLRVSVHGEPMAAVCLAGVLLAAFALALGILRP